MDINCNNNGKNQPRNFRAKTIKLKYYEQSIFRNDVIGINTFCTGTRTKE